MRVVRGVTVSCRVAKDFYSHSNWVELGKEHPNANLIRSDSSVGNLAGKQQAAALGCGRCSVAGNAGMMSVSCDSTAQSRATCRSCDGDDCRNNILDDIIAEGVLTSGYFSVAPVGATKPQGTETDLEHSSHRFWSLAA